MSNTVLTIEVPDELSRRAIARAASQGLSLAEVIRSYLEEFAKGENPTLEYYRIGEFQASSSL